MNLEESSDQKCADPESFVRGGPNLITYLFVDERLEDPNTANNGPSSARQRNAIEMVFRWRADDGLYCVSLAGRWWLGSFVIFQEIRTIIAKKPYIFVIFLGGPYPLPPPPLDPPMPKLRLLATLDTSVWSFKECITYKRYLPNSRVLVGALGEIRNAVQYTMFSLY